MYLNYICYIYNLFVAILSEIFKITFYIWLLLIFNSVTDFLSIDILYNNFLSSPILTVTSRFPCACMETIVSFENKGCFTFHLQLLCLTFKIRGSSNKIRFKRKILQYMQNKTKHFHQPLRLPGL